MIHSTLSTLAKNGSIIDAHTKAPRPPQIPQRSRERLLVVLILGVFLCAASLLCRLHAFPDVRSETDGIAYMHRAMGPGLFQPHPYWGPGYPCAIRVMILLGLDVFLAAKAVSLIFAVLFLCVSWKILSSVNGPRDGLLCLAIMALSSVTLIESTKIMSDMMSASLILCAAWMSLFTRRSGWAHALIAGALCGGAYLTRYVYIIGLGLPVVSALSRLKEGDRSTSKAIQYILAFLAGFLAVTLPWLVFVWQVKGNPFWNTLYLNIAFSMHSGAQGWNAFPDSQQYSGLTDVVFSDLSGFILNYLKRLLLFFPAHMITFVPAVGPLAIVGWAFWVMQLDRSKVVLCVASFVYVLVACLTWYDARFMLPVMPLVASWITSALMATPVTINCGARSSRAAYLLRKLPLRTTCICVSLTGLAGISGFEIRKFLREQPTEYRMAASFLEAQGGEGATVLAAKGHIPFFSGNRYLSFRAPECRLQDADVHDLPMVLRQVQADFLIYDDRYAGVEFPQLRVLLWPALQPCAELLECVFSTDVPRRLVIYRCRIEDRKGRDGQPDLEGDVTAPPQWPEYLTERHSPTNAER